MSVADGTTREERVVAVSATILFHAAALFLILSARVFISSEPDENAIAMFDIPPPAEVQPPPPDMSRPTRPPENVDTPAPAPAPLAKVKEQERPAAAAPQMLDVTAVIALPAPPTPIEFARGTGLSGTTAGPGTAGGDGGDGAGGVGAGGNGRGGGPQYLNPDWIRRPTQDEWLQIWPRRALREKRSGRVVLSCYVRSNGLPKNCDVVHEEPAGEGFGRAALNLSINFRLRPVTRNGTRLDLPVRIPLVFAHKNTATEASQATLP